MTKQNSVVQKVNASPATMDEVIKYDQTKIPKVGDIIEGTIINKTASEVHLDIDGLACGVVRGTELWDESGEYANLKINDKVQATVVELENENGELELSFRHAGHQKAWNHLIELMKAKEVVEADIVEANKGGLIVGIGRVSGFLPVSQLTPEHYPRVEGGDRNKILERLRSYVGTKFKVKVIDVDEKEEKLIVSEKTAWEEAQKEILGKYKVGDRVEGKVTGVVDFGVFVEFGDGLEGLVHISEIAWQRIDNPKDLVRVGDKVKAEIISIEGSKISLSMKKLLTDPWKGVEKKYKIGQIVKGKIIKTNPFGVFIELDKDIHGLAHISELSDKLVRDPADMVKIGSTYDFKILSIEPENHRLGLSLKAARKQERRLVQEKKSASDSAKIKDNESPAKEIPADKKTASEEKEAASSKQTADKTPKTGKEKAVPVEAKDVADQKNAK